MKAVKVEKDRPSARGYGRGMDNTYKPATYRVLQNGRLVGYIHGSERRHGAKSSWRVADLRGYLIAVKTRFGEAVKLAERYWTP